MIIPKAIIVGYIIGFLVSLGLGSFFTFDELDNAGDLEGGFVLFFGCMASLIIAIFWPIALPIALFSVVKDRLTSR